MATNALMVIDQQSEQPLPDEAEMERTIQAAIDQIKTVINRLQAEADEQVRLRLPIEQRWLRNLRAYHGKYDADTERTLTEKKRSRAFVRMTRKKTNAWEARLSDLLFPTDDRNWGIEPTPVPKLGKDAAAAIEAATKMVDQANEQMAAGEKDAAMVTAQAANDGPARAVKELQAAIDEAKKRGEAMQTVMEDQLVECQYPANARDLIRDAVRIGTGVLKGPIVGERSRGAWVNDGAGGFAYRVDPDPAPAFRRVNPWDYFPDMSATKQDEVEFDYERHLWAKKDLRRLVKESGFDKEAVRRLLDKDRSMPITAPGMTYLTELRSITGEGEQIKGRYVGWEYHGPLECSEAATMMRAMAASIADPAARAKALAEADRYEEDADPLEERRVIAHFCEGELLKIAPEYPLDSGESFYSTFPFEEGEASIFGVGIPEIMADSQSAINGSWRMAMDNGGLSVGPQVIVDTSIVEPADGSWEIVPRKLWRRNKAPTVSGDQPFQAINIPSNVNEALALAREAKAHADDETALPIIAEGEAPEQGQQTVLATSIRAAGSNVTFRRVVKAYDDGITAPAMRRLYDWNMQFNPRPDIKGDMSVDARGTSVLMVRELQSQVMLMVAQTWTTHPVISMMLRRKSYDVVRRALQSAQIQPDDVLGTYEEYEAAVKQMAEQAANQPQDPGVVAAETRLKAVEMDGQTRLQIAKLTQQTALMQLAEQRNMKLDDLKALLAKEDMAIKSKERIFAAEAGIEQQMQRDAAARGEEPQGSGGSFSA